LNWKGFSAVLAAFISHYRHCTVFCIIGITSRNSLPQFKYPQPYPLVCPAISKDKYFYQLDAACAYSIFSFPFISPHKRQKQIVMAIRQKEDMDVLLQNGEKQSSFFFFSINCWLVLNQ